MLYDGVVRFMMQAKDGIVRGDVQARHNANRRAIEIVTYLMGQLDTDTGGDAAKSLYRIYSGVLNQLMRVDFDNDAAVCDAVAAHFRTLRASLAQAYAQSQPAPVVAAAPAAPGTPVRRNAVA
jgi:flagellar biosynthetic protein FliS